MGLSVNNDLVNLSDNFESLKAKVEAIEIIVYGEKVLELDDLTDAPLELHKYIDWLEEELETPISIVSVGPDRKQTLYK